MKQLMVISHDTYASGITADGTADLDSINSLAEGAYAIIDRDPASANVNHIVKIAATTEGATPAVFQFVTKTANGLKWSPYITLKNCRVKSQAYVAPVAKIMNIAWTAPSSLTVGQTAGFIVTDTTKGAHELTRNRSYVRTVVDGDTGASIIAALIVLVNADASRVVNATAGTNIVLTRITAGKNFVTSPVGIFSTATITTSTYHVTGTGTAAQLIAYERDCNPERGGNTGVRLDSAVMNPLVSEVITTETYDTYQITFTNPNNQRNPLPLDNPIQELVLALEVTLSDNGDGLSKEGMDNFVTDINV